MMKLGKILSPDDEIGENSEPRWWNLGKFWARIMKLGKILSLNDEIGEKSKLEW